MLNFLKQGGPKVQHLKHKQVCKGCKNSQPLRNFVEPAIFAANFAMQNFAAKFHKASQFRTMKIRRAFHTAKFRSLISQPAKFCRIFATPVHFGHNFFIRTSIWMILVSLERLESVKSRYSQKEYFRTYNKDIILKIIQLVTFNLSSLLPSITPVIT